MSSKPRDITGRTFGRLKVRKDSGLRDNQGNVLWECSCKCGGSRLAAGVALRRGMVKSCGCAQNEQRSVALSTLRGAQEELKALRIRVDVLQSDLTTANSYIAYLEAKTPGQEFPENAWARMDVPDEYMAVCD